MPVILDKGFTEVFIKPSEIEQISSSVLSAQQMLMTGTGPGNDFLGWVNLPSAFDEKELKKINDTAQKIISQSDVVLVVGIGGSYLGARAAIEFLKSPLYNNLPDKTTPDIYFVGNDFSGSHINEVLEICGKRRVSVIVISKSGTTTESALVFRTLRDYMKSRYGAEAAGRIYAVTDKSKGTLRKLCEDEGYESFVIPDNIGGRFSVLSPVGLLPMACAGVDINRLLAGAKSAEQELSATSLESNPCLMYVALRNILHKKGKLIEIFVGYEPYQLMFTEWLKQLFGESEGKDHKGIFPAGVQFSTDLHSMGQFIQDGSRIMFETGISIGTTTHTHIVASDPHDLDGLEFLAGKSFDEINILAATGVALAHEEGATPTIMIKSPQRSAYQLGYLFYFFMMACGVSAYVLGVNPFDQPGVESYKKNMFALLGKPGYEETARKLNQKLRSNS